MFKGIILINFACQEIRYPDVEVNPGPRDVVSASCRMFSNINGLHGNLDELAVAASHFDIVFCCETEATRRRHVAELRSSGTTRPGRPENLHFL